MNPKMLVIILKDIISVDFKLYLKCNTFNLCNSNKCQSFLRKLDITW